MDQVSACNHSLTKRWRRGLVDDFAIAKLVASTWLQHRAVDRLCSTSTDPLQSISVMSDSLLFWSCRSQRMLTRDRCSVLINVRDVPSGHCHQCIASISSVTPGWSTFVPGTVAHQSSHPTFWCRGNVRLNGGTHQCTFDWDSNDVIVLSSSPGVSEPSSLCTKSLGGG